MNLLTQLQSIKPSVPRAKLVVTRPDGRKLYGKNVNLITERPLYQAAILKALVDGPKCSAQVGAVTGVTRQCAYKRLVALEVEGRVLRGGSGIKMTWRLA